MKLCLVFGDQLSHELASIQALNPEHDQIVMVEVMEEATYVKHHQKKIAFVFAAMRHFAEELRQRGFEVHYHKLDDPNNQGGFLGVLESLLAASSFSELLVTQPSEYRLQQAIHDWQQSLSIPVTVLEDDRFLCSIADFAHWAQGRKQLRMEFFYRMMRVQHQILMDGDQPVGGQWNYDADNRKPPKKGLVIPKPLNHEVDAITAEVLAMVAARFSDHFGDLEPFHFAVTRAQALAVLKHFIVERLPQFGDYQDAMLENEPWMYHSHISFYLNCGLLQPKECIAAVEQAYRRGQAPLNAAEGFIRQILGWREYVRGIYWLHMPNYAQLNFLGATRKLPSFYWTGQTSMNCLAQCVTETKKHAYAHHIQRLMVLGNFALIAGLAPEQVNEWFLVVYADAYEWVELPNVSGMILFADGGYLASKPYAAGGSYINKMSNYCKNCRFKVSVKNGPDACPFNYLYWDFLVRNRATLANNPRVAMMYRTYDRMADEKKQAIAADSEKFLATLAHASDRT